MPFHTLNELLAHTSPGFVCEGAGVSRTEQFLAKITHLVPDAASTSDLSKLKQMIAVGSEELLEFYGEHNGLILYKDTIGNAEGVELFAVENMADGTAELRSWLDMGGGAADYNNLKTAIAIGQVPHSGNYFAMPVEGPGVGKVYYVDHDDWREDPYAKSFNEFVIRITSSPAKLLSEDLGCYARYSDGTTNIQWIPIEYLPDISKAIVT